MECAIPMCGCEDTILMPACENGHWIHAECLKNIMESSGLAVCPLCRSASVEKMHDSVAIDVKSLSRTPFSVLGATLAVYVGKMQRNLQ